MVIVKFALPKFASQNWSNLTGWAIWWDKMSHVTPSLFIFYPDGNKRSLDTLTCNLDVLLNWCGAYQWFKVTFLNFLQFRWQLNLAVKTGRDFQKKVQSTQKPPVETTFNAQPVWSSCLKVKSFSRSKIICLIVKFLVETLWIY